MHEFYDRFVQEYMVYPYFFFLQMNHLFIIIIIIITIKHSEQTN